MRRLAQKHGPVMMLWLGEVPTLVASSPDADHAVMKTHDVLFADRHINATINCVTFNGTDLVFSPYGEWWRQLRKFVVVELLCAARVRSFQRIREDEVARLTKHLAASASAGATVNLSKMISNFVNDTFVMESVGSRCAHRDEYLDLLNTVLRLTSEVTIGDLFPSSRVMQTLISTVQRKVLNCRNRIQCIMEQIIQEKVEAMEHGDQTAAEGHEGLLGVLLRLQKEGNAHIPLTNKTIVNLMFDMFGAASETSSTTLTWCMTELVRSPATMAKAQAEVREALKGKSVITEDDIAVLSYLKLVIKEALRLHTPVPLLVPRKCRETCQIMGYDISKGTAVFVNVWAICRDPKYWDDPEEFKPERFENSKLDFKGTNYEFLPFRRMCPGINLGLANMELALASLLYHFDWELPDGMKPKDVDISESIGLVGCRKPA